MRDAGSGEAAAAAHRGHTGRMAAGFPPRPGPSRHPASSLDHDAGAGTAPAARCSAGGRARWANGNFMSLPHPLSSLSDAHQHARGSYKRRAAPSARPPILPSAALPIFEIWGVSHWLIQPGECTDARRASPPQARSARAARPAPTRSGRRRRCGWGQSGSCSAWQAPHCCCVAEGVQQRCPGYAGIGPPHM